ncbi:hypothetical protein A0R60_0532 [Enterobacter asburiae]|nr:hypothetical protein A0R60_0532 [Enterobacter asburiae]
MDDDMPWCHPTIIYDCIIFLIDCYLMSIRQKHGIMDIRNANKEKG